MLHRTLSLRRRSYLIQWQTVDNGMPPSSDPLRTGRRSLRHSHTRLLLHRSMRKSLPIPSLIWIVARFEITRARYIVSSDTCSSFAKTTIGTEAVIPWLPLPELITTGSSQPFILASEPASRHGFGAHLDILIAVSGQ